MKALELEEMEYIQGGDLLAECYYKGKIIGWYTAIGIATWAWGGAALVAVGGVTLGNSTECFS
jgi:hypothetical protein